MIKNLCVLTILFCSLASHAQSKYEYLTAGEFVLKGKVTNAKQTFFEIGITSLLGRERISIPLDADGRYKKTIPIVNAQDFGFLLDSVDAFLFAVPGDTLEINWDDNKVTRSFKVRSNSKTRQQELNLMLALTQGKQRDRALQTQLYSNLTDTAKFKLIKQSLAADIRTALQYPLTKYSPKIWCDIYYKHLAYLNRPSFLGSFELKLKHALPDKLVDSMEDYIPGAKDVVRGELLMQSSAYRDYQFDYVRFNYKYPGKNDVMLDAHQQPNPTQMDCRAGMAAFFASPIAQDWFLTQSILFGFAHYQFDATEQAYNTHLSNIKASYFRDTLQRFYANMQRLKPGSAAPDFTLTDLEGKNVSLSNFKNKVVYIDFWGVYCGPCIYEIKNHAANLYEKYKDQDIVFLNICLDVKGQEWQDNCKKLNLHGVNLSVDDVWTSEVCQLYNVRSIPHYVLIDKEGRIVNNNARRPSEQLRGESNEIEKLFSSSK